MGADYYAYTVLGCKIPKEKLYELKEYWCDHNPPQDANFCPICGKKKYSKYSIKDKFLHNNEEAWIDSFPVIWSTDDEEAYIGLFNGSDYDGKTGFSEINGKQIEELKRCLKEILTLLGMWDENAFGLWTILYCSY